MEYTPAQSRDLYLLTDYLNEVRYTQSEFDSKLHWVMIEDLIQDCFTQYYIFLSGSFTPHQWYGLFRDRCIELAKQQDFTTEESNNIGAFTLRTYDFVCFANRTLGIPEPVIYSPSEYVKL